MTADKLKNTTLPIGNDTFQKEMNSHFDEVFDAGSKALVDGIKGGGLNDISTLAKIASAALGGL